MGLGKFYWEALKRASIGYQFWYAEKWTGVATIVAGLLAFYFGREDVMIWIPAAILACVFFIFFIAGWTLAPYQLYREEKERADALELAQAEADSSGEFPDWKFRDLFLYLRPELPEGENSDEWISVGQEVLDKLAIGQLAAWGRPIREDGMEAIVGAESRPRKIEKDYWQQADFTYQFLAEGAEQEQHCWSRDATQPAYADLQISRTEARATWPNNYRLRLTQLRSEGVVIRNNGRRMNIDFPTWEREALNWFEKAKRTIAAESSADAEWFRVLDTVPPPRLEIIKPAREYAGAHLKLYREHDYRLTKLDELIASVRNREA